MAQMQKKMLIAGIMNRAGKSQKTGNNYSMFMATILEPQVISGTIVNAVGYEAREVECDEQVLSQLQREPMPVEVEAFLDLTRDNKVKIQSIRIVEAAKLSPVKAGATA